MCESDVPAIWEIKFGKIGFSDGYLFWTVVRIKIFLRGLKSFFVLKPAQESRQPRDSADPSRHRTKKTED